MMPASPLKDAGGNALFIMFNRFSIKLSIVYQHYPFAMQHLNRCCR